MLLPHQAQSDSRMHTKLQSSFLTLPCSGIIDQSDWTSMLQESADWEGNLLLAPPWLLEGYGEPKAVSGPHLCATATHMRGDMNRGPKVRTHSLSRHPPAFSCPVWTSLDLSTLGCTKSVPLMLRHDASVHRQKALWSLTGSSFRVLHCAPL